MAQQSWTDATLTEGTTMIKAVHFTELQDAINAWETAYSITNTTWTQPAISADDEEIIDDTLDELQAALLNLETLSGATLPTGMAARDAGNSVTDNHVEQVRSNMNHLQDQACYQCHTCDNYSSCSCDSTCHNYSSCTCNNTCYSQASCSCNNTCYVQGCTCNNKCYNEDKDRCITCDNECYQQSCSCNGTCYSHSSCSCNNTCYQQASCSCNSACFGYSCSSCYSANYEYPWT